MAKDIRFYDLLGAANADKAAALWPSSRVATAVGGACDPKQVVEYLQSALVFRNIRPGSDGTRVGLYADVSIQNSGPPAQAVITQMPDIAFRLLDADTYPVRLFVTKGDAGPEILIESLPVEILFPVGMLEPDPQHLSDIQSPPTSELKPDGLAIVLRSGDNSSVFVRVRVRMTEEMDFIIEPAVPVSLPRCSFLSLPCKAVHDVNWVPSPKLAGNHTSGEQALEWTRHRLDQLSVSATCAGVLTARTVDLDADRSPFPELLAKMNAGRSDKEGIDKRPVEFVLEDIALPFENITALPIPSHGQFGLRRRIEPNDSAEKAYQFDEAPVSIALPWNWRLIIEEFWLKTPGKGDVQPCTFKAALLFGPGEDVPQAFTLGLTDEWTLQAGWRSGNKINLFTLFGCTVSLWGAKLGWSFGRALDASSSWADLFQVLLDLSLASKPAAASGWFEIRNAVGGPLDVTLREIGWDRGSLAFEKASLPEGAELVFGRMVTLAIEEMGFVTESNGGEYFSFSGGICVVGKSGKAGGGIRFYRLRGLTGGNTEAPRFLLDGVSLDIIVGTAFHLYGFGMVSEFTQGQPPKKTRYSEFGFGIKIEFEAFLQKYAIGAQFFYGRAEGEFNFKYLLFGLQFSPIPCGTFQFLDVRVLGAWNMTPDLPPPDGNAENLRLFHWYKSHGAGVVTLSANDRTMSGWTRREDSWAGGVGAGITLPVGRFVRLDAFLFLHSGPENAGLLFVLEAYMFRGGKPVGFGAVDYDWHHDRWGVMLGVALTLSNLTGIDLPDWIEDQTILSGTLYAGNQPATFALGRLADQATWLTFSFEAPFLETGGVVAYCLEAVDKPEGPCGCGFAITVKGGWNFGFGSIQLYGSFGYLAGLWRNESTSGGFAFWFAIGLRIKVFWIFVVGIEVKVDFVFLGRLGAGSYRTLGCLITIETPWWLPDISYRFDRTWEDKQLENVEVFSTPLIGASAVDAAKSTQQIQVTPLTGTAIDERAIFCIAELQNANKLALPAGGLGDKVPVVAIDSVIAIDFMPAVDNKSSKGSSTTSGDGIQMAKPPAKNTLSTAYEVTAFSVSRRPRFGPGAGKWIDCIAPGDTRLKKPWQYASQEELTAHFTEKDYGWTWNADFLREGKIEPRQMLLNTSVPYTIVSSNPDADESIARNMPGWPCCPTEPQEPPWHLLDFKGTRFGERTSTSQEFSQSYSRLVWLVRPPPIVVPGQAAPTAEHAARIHFSKIGDGNFATVALDEPAYQLELNVYWLPRNVGSSLLIQAYRGLDLVKTNRFKLDVAVPTLPVVFEIRDGFDSLIFEYKDGKAEDYPRKTDWIELVSIRYTTLRECLDAFTAAQKCKAAGERALKGEGKFVWLPNHDYAITLTTSLALSEDAACGTQGSYAKQVEVDQKTFFRTKGMIGLNSVKRIGDEVAPYVESCYPAAGPVRLYREEPIALAFSEDFNIVLPAIPYERAPNPDDPLGLTHVAEWLLTVDKLGGAGDGERLSASSEDWLTAHRVPEMVVVPQKYPAAEKFVSKLVREAATIDPFKIRFETMIANSAGCAKPGTSFHKSLVLLHEAISSQELTSASQLWPADSVLRANLRLKGAPFTERTAFHVGDETAFEMLSEGAESSETWVVSDGALICQAAGIGIRYYAVFGEKGWNHVQIHASVDPGGGTAGVAIAVESQAGVTKALLAVVDEAANALKLTQLSAGVAKFLKSSPLPADSKPPYGLEVIVSDDVLRFTVSDRVIECDREGFRDGKLALVAQGGTKFTKLIVEPLDAYRFEARTSRFQSFKDHIQSCNREITKIPAGIAGAGAASETVASLLTKTKSRIADVMKPTIDPEMRQRLFDIWSKGLAFPLRTRLQRLAISSCQDVAGIEMMLIEGPEPLAFGRDVKLEISKPVVHHVQLGQPLFGVLQGTTFELGLHSGNVVERKVIEEEQALLSRCKHAVRAIVVEGEQQYEIYHLEPGVPGRCGLQIKAKRMDLIIQADINASEVAQWRAALEVMSAESILFLDERGASLAMPVDSVSWITYDPVPITVLTDGDETRAIVIPLSSDGTQPSALGKGDYTLDFTLDRTRYRSNSVDQYSNYKAQEALSFILS